MSKNFSVEWLSQSYHEHMGLENSHDPNTFHPSGGGEKLPSSPANSCGFTSDDDSEGESHRRVRAKFTSEQISRLQRTFNKHRYLGASQRRKIAEKLHLSETQVKTWFQNRRMKLKREVQDMRAAQYFVPPVTSLQHHTESGQRQHHFYIHQPVHPIMFTSAYF